MLEEERDAVVSAPLGGMADSVHEPGPRLRVRGLERIVVALDPRPDDEVGAELAREVDRVERSLHGLGTRGLVRRDEPTSSEPRVEVKSRRDAVHGVVAERVADVVEVLGVELLRIVELVVVDEISQPVDRAAHALGGRLVRPLRLVAARDEARHHRPEGPYPE